MIEFDRIQGPKDSKVANFEAMCSQLILSRFPNVKPVDGKGRDAGYGLFSGSPQIFSDWHDLRVFQYEYFCDALTAYQKQQIELSLQKAIANWHPWSWALCIPKNLLPSEQRWFNTLEAKYCDIEQARKIPRKKLCFMVYWDEKLLRSLLAQFPHVRNRFFPVNFTPEQELQIRKIVTNIVTELPQELAFISKIKDITNRLGHDAISIQYDIVDWAASPKESLDDILSRMLHLDYSGAKRELLKWIPEHKNDNALKYLFLGNCFFALKEYREAIKAYTQCLDFPYYQVNACNNRGVSYRRVGALDDALSDFNAVIRINPCLAEPYANRAVVQKIREEYELAKADLDKAISLKNDFFEAYFNRAIVHARLGDYTAAMQDFDKAEPILQELHWIEWFKTGNTDFAAASLSTVLEVHAHDVAREVNPYEGHNRSGSLSMLRNVCPADISTLRWFVDKYLEEKVEAVRPQVKRIDKLLSPEISVLFVAAAPTDLSRLRIGEEFREIQEKLRLARFRDRFDLHQQTSVRPADISQALLDIRPEIVHFSGHGKATGTLCFENQLGETHPIQPDALAALFEQFANQVKCVVLNACYSEIQAKAIAEHIDYVIGMNQAVGDKAAIAFAIGFYQALGAGRTIEDAYKLGCVQIRLQGIPEHLTPILIRKGGM